jgi:TRAP-type C4-dicarboxylate transport system substrate-binding protein
VGQLRDAVLEEVGPMRLMTVSNTGGWRNFATVGKQIKTPDDVRGMKIRTLPADIQIELVKALGGSPTPVSWPEVYTSLATGVVEGTKNGITDIVNMKFQEHLDYITLDGHAYMAALWWMNDDFFKGLTPDQQKVVHDGFMHLRTVTRALPMRRSIEAYEEFKKDGGEAPPWSGSRRSPSRP